MDQPLLQTSVEVWEYLLSQGGMDLKSYDSDILNEMRGKLNIPLLRGKNDFKQELILHKIDAEQLIIAFFSAVAPFSSMMSDLLVQFEKSGALRTTHNLKIKFDFDAKSTALEFDLEHFRSWQIQFIHALRPVYVYEVNPEVLFQLYSDLRRFLDVTGLDWNPHHQEVKRWISDYDSDSLPKYTIIFPSVGDEEFDRVFSSLYELWQQVWADCLFHNVTRTTGVQTGKDADDYKRCLQKLESDMWLRQFLLILEVLHSRSIPGTCDAGRLNVWWQDVVQFMTKLLGSITRTLRNKSVLTQELVSLLELPIWRKRYDLYAAWISTQIMVAMNDSSMTYIHENGTVTFSFSRNHLATSRKYEPTLELWAEVRTPLANPRGKSRQRGIQPDYSLLTEIADAERSTLLVVECKQYRRAGSKNFADALNDYARGRPNARVLIVNYGKGSSSIVSRVDHKFKSSVKVIHEMRPNSVTAIQEFQDYLKETITQACLERSFDATVSKANVQVNANPAPLPLRVTLTWGKQPKDLDLHLTIVTSKSTASPVNVDYRSKGSSSVFPWAVLNKDEQVGFGPEEIQVFQYLPGVYHFHVNNYSNMPSLIQSEAKITIYLNGHPPIEIPCPVAGDSELWEVFSYDSVKDQLRIYNRIKMK
ncbi:YfaP family protein [Brevibacillus sp. Leaf182]|uniref:YfaP family protein n=1 Tax=Brevibacillus sp. Leaf182 TaxID=1736290 RepID=UPI0006F98C37|nr:hypothetical protein [Brevibacillus sp. Leaf182]RAT97843.1 hypothetical protein ASG16_009355 [Brevibacillus sp. Leaf182]